MSLQDEFMALPRWQREEAYKAARKKLGNSKSIHIDELMAAHKSIKGVA